MIYSIPPTGPGGLRSLKGHHALGKIQPPPISSTRSEAGDRVELSEVAVIVAKLSGTPPERMAKILSIKREIDLGNYLSQSKLNDALQRMIDSISARYARRS